MKSKLLSQVRTRKQKRYIPLTLPIIPDKCYFTISEVGQLCAVQPYVLRYWEREFLQLKPIKRRGNRRYYQHHDILMIRQIRKLLYEDGFTIEGARTKLQLPLAQNTSTKTDIEIKKMIADLEGILQELRAQEVSQ